jgi:hypothetical protein
VSVAEPETVREALDAAAQTGAFFRLEAGEAVLGPDWLPVAELKDGGLANLVTRTTAQLGTREWRVAASIVHLSLAARLWSPVLGCGLLRSVVPDLRTLVVSPGPPARLGLAEVAGWAVQSPGQIAALSADVVSAQLATLAGELRVALPAGLLRGNSASAMAGALGVLVRRNPQLARPAIELAHALLQTSHLQGAGTLGDSAPMAFRRQSCCLYYRVPGAGLCGDCCLTHAPDRRRL